MAERIGEGAWHIVSASPAMIISFHAALKTQGRMRRFQFHSFGHAKFNCAIGSVLGDEHNNSHHGSHLLSSYSLLSAVPSTFTCDKSQLVTCTATALSHQRGNEGVRG